MRKILLAAVIGAAIVASLTVTVRPSGNEANAQNGLSKAVAACILKNLDRALADQSIRILVTVCKTLSVHG